MKEKHESYGMLQLSRSQYGGAVSLFGSSIEHENVIRLRICKGEVDRHLSKEWYYTSLSNEDTFVEAEMSYSQFAEAITSLNMGGGVPITIRQQGEMRFERPPFEPKEVTFKNEYFKRAEGLIESIGNGMETVNELLNQKKPLNKAEKDEITSVLENAYRTLTNGLPFMQSMYMEQMDKTTMEAKGEIEAFLQNKINQIAMTAIGENHEQFIAESKQNMLTEHTENESVDEEMEYEEEPYHGMSMG